MIFFPVLFLKPFVMIHNKICTWKSTLHVVVGSKDELSDKKWGKLWVLCSQNFQTSPCTQTFSVTPLWVCKVFIIIFCGRWWQLNGGWQKQSCKHMFEMINSSRSGKCCLWLKVAKSTFNFVVLSTSVGISQLDTLQIHNSLQSNFVNFESNKMLAKHLNYNVCVST